MSLLIKKRFTLKEISKGSASGEDEADFLENFEDYFYDYESISEKVIAPNIFYLIGRKGTGKSILAKYVEKKFSDRELYFNKFVTVSSFRNFKYQTLQEYRDKDFSEKEYFFIWKWCLLINVAYQLIEDQSCTNNESLLSLGVFLKENFGVRINQKKVFDRSKNIKWTLGTSKVAQVSGSVDSDIEVGDYLDYLESLEEIIISLGQSTLSKFTIFYDDLDDGFEGSDLYSSSMCSLIYAVDELNRSFLRSGFSAKYILLLRSDIFRVLNSPDLNKFKMDNSLMLDWRPEERENSPLFSLAIHRIVSALKLTKYISENDYNKVFYELFEGTTENRKTALWILDRTFARPRDLVQLLKIAGNEFPSFDKYTAFTLIKTQGLYSQYLYDDVRNEMKGHKDSDFVEQSLSLLKGIGKGNTLTLEKIKNKKPHLFSTSEGIEKVKEMLKFLYRFSVIGNIYHNSDNVSKIESYSWSHREDQAEPDYDAVFTIHQGIRIALKIETKAEHTEKVASFQKNFRSIIEPEDESLLLHTVPYTKLEAVILEFIYRLKKPVNIHEISESISMSKVEIMNNTVIEKVISSMVEKDIIYTVMHEEKQCFVLANLKS